MPARHYVLIVNYSRNADALCRNTDLLKELYSNNELKEKNVLITHDPLDGLYQIYEKEIPIVILDAELSGNDNISIGECLQFYKTTKKLFPRKTVLIYTDIEFQKIDEESSRINVKFYRRNYFKKVDGFTGLKDRIDREIDLFLQKQISFNDQWIIERLNDGQSFKNLLGIQSIEPLDDKVKEEFEKHESHDYSVWFSDEIYNDIFEKRIFRILKFAGLDDIKSTLEHFLEFERMSYITPFYSENKRYRDHFLHQLRVAVLGDFLLNTIIKSGKKEKRLVEVITSILKNRESTNNPNCDFDEKMVRNTWWITALMHDCSYPLLSIFSPHLFGNESLKKLGGMFIGELYEQFKKDHDTTMENLRRNSESKLLEMIKEVELTAFYPFIQDTVKTNISHNIYSAYNFWKKYREDSYKNLCFELIVQSILLHHEFCEKEDDELPIIFKDYPLAFLLILADEIQEWGRPFILREKAPDPTAITKMIELYEVSTEGIFKGLKSNQYYLKKEGITFTFNYKNIQSQLSDKENKFKPTKKYNDKKKNLSRLWDQGKTLPPITLEFKSRGVSPGYIKIRRGRRG